MQTKNINIERAPNNSTDGGGTRISMPETVLMIQRGPHNFFDGLQTNGDADSGAPPLPPRTALIFTPLPAVSKPQVEVEGYGPYKPVPPPKPLPQQPISSQQGCLTPPPYRMPPYPLYNEPSIPGATGLDTSPATQGLHTHSSKFPIEREVILSSTDKNSKIPILHDYKKRTKGAIAPDVPPKQMAAWTAQGQTHQILSPDQNHTGMVQSPHQQSEQNAVFRATYHPPPQEYYNGQANPSTGAVPRQSWHGGDNKSTPRPYPEDFSQSNSQQVTVQIEQPKEQKDKKSMTKTYHTIKDIISSRFKSSKDNTEEKSEEPGLNNVAEELRRSQRNIGEEQQEKKTEQNIYGKPRIDPNISHQQHQYNQHIMLQAQQYQVNQQLKMQQTMYQQQLVQARSQEMLVARPEEQVYYQNAYGATPQRPGNRFVSPANREQNYVQMHHSQFPAKEKDDRRQPIAMERRSAQQIERDSQRQKSFEARRAASHPQLAYDDETKTEVPDSRPQPQAAPMRRGSHGNIMEAAVSTAPDAEKDSDDGGFLKRNNSKEKKNPEINQEEDSKVTEALQGTPRKRLEGEIGKIEGVYNVGQRSKDDEGRGKKNPSGSAASSDYDKAGQSSSNADSGRGSAAYSSGRRPGGLDLNGEGDTGQLQGHYRDHHGGHDSEWVDIVENELRHILEPKLHELSLQGGVGIANSTLSESISSMTPPLPPLSPGEQSSPNVTPRNSTRYKPSSLPYGSKPDYDGYKSKLHTGRETSVNSRWHNNSNQKHRSTKKSDHSTALRGKQIFGLDTTDLTSTTTRSLDLESMLDGQSDSDGDISTTDARAIRKQLEGLETMYSEVLKLLGVKKYSGRYQPSDPRFSKRRYGSMSSLPSSSVSSRPIRDKRRAHEDRKKVRDIRGINKRFQRLESHVVTLARSVAHLSSEMRTQHLMIQEMENIRGEIAALRTQTNMLNVRSQSASRAVNTSKDLPTLANPTRVKKLTKFFGDEPPLLRLFLRKLGYEKYANVFESERVGMVELPYLSEERLQKMGVPLGPRLRIMQEAQISVCKDNTLCIV
ncbi:uncharacterized protein LOC100141693 isoform X2 [Tribolium castaneum]|uniref:uncharacterized protein LOC100141693 isoform X2 n=1 Tax=Tribolium castaneum TaxID=7070 RepID=UPI00077DB0A2|nr:PREDICTED: uncharacterized protein LOC100141693 isoform X2 [Tribolium castaneum]|eukprot:XP_015834407.1 PREDICTED: uncharacterized protein LOC100141693 isoform X2 [Tribolium castaneum]